MKEVVKSIIKSKSLNKWINYRNVYKRYFEGRDKEYDNLVEFIDSFHRQYDTLPTIESIQYELNSTNEFELLKYFEELMDDSEIIFIEDDSNFYTHLRHLKKSYYEEDLSRECDRFINQMSSMSKKDLPNLKGLNDEFLMKMHGIRNLTEEITEAEEFLLYGEEAVQHMKDVYEGIQEKKKEEGVVYYDFGLPGFESLLFKAGDLIFYGGFTGHGKSIWLRQITYRLLVEYGRNVVFFTHEMGADVLKNMFTCQHANNKDKFPDAPKISYRKIKHGELNEEEYNFLFDVANRDFFNNPEYGTLHIINPSQSVYSMDDLENKIKEIEYTIMPCHAVVVDYLSLVRPRLKGSVTVDDYNAMIQRFKNRALSHRNAKGELKPFIAISACQLNREGLAKCIKSNNKYEISSIRQYSSIEHASDIIMTSLLTDEAKQNNQIRLQNLKTRDEGMVIEPKDYFIDFDAGPTIVPIQERSREELKEIIKEISI